MMEPEKISKAQALRQRGKFITLEGIDGGGKSTHLAFVQNLVSDFLHKKGKKIVVTREPGDTELGAHLRELVLNQKMHPRTAALLLFADRSEHIDQLVEPNLSRGQWVLSDRFTDATFAYQGGGYGVPSSQLKILERWVHPHLQPDLTLLFDIPAELALERLQKAKRDGDLFEKNGATFFSNVRNAYLRRAQQYAKRFAIIDASGSVDQVQEQLKTLMSAWLK